MNDLISDRYTTLFFWKFLTKWLPSAIKDVRNSLSIAFLPILDQYGNFIFLIFFTKCRRRTFWMFENHFWLRLNTMLWNDKLSTWNMFKPQYLLIINVLGINYPYRFMHIKTTLYLVLSDNQFPVIIGYFLIHYQIVILMITRCN